MAVSNTTILVTGEYWHSDFQGLISGGGQLTVTLLPSTKIEQLTGDENYDLIVIAQSRRSVVAEESVQHIQKVFPVTPTVALLGSWCEGASRSGEPWPGVPRIYWTQWKGEFQSFIRAVESCDTHSWQLPQTATDADRVSIPTPHFGQDNFRGVIGVSAWSQDQYLMIADAVGAFGARTCWIERSNLDPETVSLIKSVILDDESQTGNLKHRIRWVFSTVGKKPLVLTLGFPRSDEIDSLRELGVNEFVSKPFTLGALKQAVLGASGVSSVSTRLSKTG